MLPEKIIAFFPEASYGAALNCVGIAQAVRRSGHRPVFICHPGFSGVFAEYGFPEYPLADTERPTDWNDFIERHQEAFRQSPIDQIDAYVAPTWEAIVDTAIRVEEPLRQLLARLKPDVIVLDNVVMFPAIANAGVPWVRIVSCAETEILDENIPPYLSGCGDNDRQGWDRFRSLYEKTVAPTHKRFSAFLNDCGLKPPVSPSFLDPSPYLNLLLAPEIIRHERRDKLDPRRFVFLDGCVRHEAPYPLPRFASYNEAPLAFVSFGSLGAMDVAMMKRMIGVFSELPYRFLVNAGHWREEYREVPDNVFIDSWFPQPSVVEQASLFIHHGGNNSFCEALYFGVPSLVMPYCWDGHDNAARALETGVGQRLDRYNWTAPDLQVAIRSLIEDATMRRRLKENASTMRNAAGAMRAAQEIVAVARSSEAAVQTNREP
jgi:MGT family glycosyltransferase